MILTRRGKIVLTALWIAVLIAFYLFFPIIPSWV